MENRIPENQHLSFLAAGFAAFICVLFGANAVAIKVGLSGIGPFTAAGIRFGLAALVIYIWSRMTGQTLIIKKEQLRPILTLSAIFTVQLSLLYLGISKTSASRGTLLINLQPFFILFIAHYYIPGDQLTKRKLLGLLLGFSGVAFVFLEKKGITSDFRIGDTILIAAAFLWACNGVYTKKLIVDFHPYQLIFYPMVISVPIFFFQTWIWDEAMFVHINMKVLGALFYQSFVTASFGFMAWTRMLQKHSATALHSFLFIMPISGVVLGGLLLDEPITSKIILALILIAMGILTIHLKTKIGIPFFHLQKHL